MWATSTNQIPDGTKINRRGYLFASTSFESLFYVKSKFQRGAKGVKIFIANISRPIFIGIFNSCAIIVLIIGVSRPIRNWLGRGGALKNEEHAQWMGKIKYGRKWIFLIYSLWKSFDSVFNANRLESRNWFIQKYRGFACKILFVVIVLERNIFI